MHRCIEVELPLLDEAHGGARRADHLGDRRDVPERGVGIRYGRGGAPGEVAIAAGVEDRVTATNDHDGTGIDPLLDPVPHGRVDLGDRLGPREGSAKDHDYRPPRTHGPPRGRTHADFHLPLIVRPCPVGGVRVRPAGRAGSPGWPSRRTLRRVFRGAGGRPDPGCGGLAPAPRTPCRGAWCPHAGGRSDAALARRGMPPPGTAAADRRGIGAGGPPEAGNDRARRHHHPHQVSPGRHHVRGRTSGSRSRGWTLRRLRG